MGSQAELQAVKDVLGCHVNERSEVALELVCQPLPASGFSLITRLLIGGGLAGLGSVHEGCVELLCRGIVTDLLVMGQGVLEEALPVLVLEVVGVGLVGRVPTLAEFTIDIPRDFFLHGWVSVLYPTEIATWLTLRFLARRFPGVHNESGVYLYGEDREQWFGLRRDAYEDSCAMLLGLGLIRPAQRRTPPPEATPASTDFNTLLASIDFSQPSQPNRYEAHRYQLTDDGLREDALAVCLREVVHKRNNAS
ncbi:hypothetical protein AB0D86_49415 [Streptomyces sp. NPDC048324]|uniref:hypothetical protein n=1 Tax=Streptomyces sp. NPDC048324 TaxID=3157205 RepID=UPI00341C42D0